jgi:hypothetical protein
MKIFGIEFGKVTGVVRTEPQALSTPFGIVGDGNLSLPFIQSNTTKAGVVYFGGDNLFPSLLNQMYYTSPLHSSIVDFTVNAVCGGGFEITGTDTAKSKVDAQVWVQRNKVAKLLRVVTRDYKLHDRVHLLLKFNASGKFLTMTRVEPASIRYRMDGLKEYSSDWSTGRNRRTIESYHPAKIGQCEEMLYTFQTLGAGQDIYPIPAYSSALNWVFLDGEQSFFHKSNIQNSIFPSMVVRRPKRFQSKKEMEDFKEGLQAKKGAKNAGAVQVLTGDGMENVPEVVFPSANNNDKLFEGTARELKDNICFAHGINPSIMGIKVAGSLGNAQELEMSYSIYEKNIVNPFREEIQEMFNELMQICSIEGVFEVKQFKIIGDTVVEEQANKNKTAELLSAMSPLLSNSILKVMTTNEQRALGGLKPIEGGDVVPTAQPDFNTPTV